MPFQTVSNLTQNEVAITKNGSDTSGWISAKGAEGFNFWLYMTAAGAPDVTVTFEYTLLPPGYSRTSTKSTDGLDLLDPNSTDRTNYRSVTIKANETTQDAWQHYNTPTELKYPMSHYRIKCTENNVAAVTTLSFIVAHNGMR